MLQLWFNSGQDFLFATFIALFHIIGINTNSVN